MKKRFLIIATLISVTFSFSQSKRFQKESFKVWGNCGMCKSVIENAAESLEGVKYAKWNVRTGILKVKFKENLVDLKTIQKSIANTGYDTDLYRADDKIYNDLHYCCKYERKSLR